MPERPRSLDEDEIVAQLRRLSGWEVSGEKLTRAFKFKDFTEAIDFVNRVAPVAESKSHYPDLQVSWGLLAAELTTHDAPVRAAGAPAATERARSSIPASDPPLAQGG